MKLISEHFSNDVEYITEATEDGKKNYKLKGVFLQAEIKNRNGRVYPMEILEKEVANTIVTQHIPEVEEDEEEVPAT